MGRLIIMNASETPSKRETVAEFLKRAKAAAKVDAVVERLLDMYVEKCKENKDMRERHGSEIRAAEQIGFENGTRESEEFLYQKCYDCQKKMFTTISMYKSNKYDGGLEYSEED